MILLNNIVHVLAGPAFTFLGQPVVLLQVTDGANVSGILVDIDYPWGGDMRLAQSFSEKPLGRPSAAGTNERKAK